MIRVFVYTRSKLRKSMPSTPQRHKTTSTAPYIVAHLKNASLTPFFKTRLLLAVSRGTL